MSEAVLMWSLGGRAGISAAVYKLYDRIANDDQLAPYFADTNLMTCAPTWSTSSSPR